MKDFAEFYGPAEKTLLGLATRLSNPSDAEDLLATATVSMLKYWHSFDPKKGKFVQWASRIIFTTNCNILKKKRPALVDNEILDVNASSEPDPASHVESMEQVRLHFEAYVFLCALYESCFSILSERSQLALRLVEIERKSYREAADIMNVSLGNIKMIICRSRARIADEMAKRMESHV